jgi:hypothetical protein
MTSPLEHDLPFEWGWWGMDLGPARPVEYTYELFPYDSLPPLPALDGTLDWLGPVDVRVHGAARKSGDLEARSQLARIEHAATQLGLTEERPESPCFQAGDEWPVARRRRMSYPHCYFRPLAPE